MIKKIMRAIKWLWAHERHLSGLFLAGGFAFDNYFFGRIDRPETQLIFIAYLAMAAVSIAVLHWLESRHENKKHTNRARSVLVFATQFALGCLLSGFCVFYIRSATVVASWPFLLFMAGIFIGNEIFRKYNSRLVFASLLFYFSLFSYAIFLVPLLIHRIGTAPFLLSGLLSLSVFFFYLRGLAWLGHDRYRGARREIMAGVIGISVLINVFYFAKILPPLPLALSDAGVYHSIRRVGPDFLAAAESDPPAWRALLGTHPVKHLRPGGKLYLYSAIFAPSGLRTRITHEWQWLDKNGDWKVQQRIMVPIFGGRDNGYRFFSNKSGVQPGQWRVNIATADGRSIGRVRFSVVHQPAPPDIKAITLK